jgi:hypothetical protein
VKEYAGPVPTGYGVPKIGRLNKTPPLVNGQFSLDRIKSTGHELDAVSLDSPRYTLAG